MLDNVVEARQPHLRTQALKQTGLGSAQINQQLSFWSQVLRDVAGDFLTGDFSAVDEAGTLIRRRVAAHPQEIKVFIPSDAPEGEEARQVEEVQGTVPPEVGISVHRYQRPTSD